LKTEYRLVLMNIFLGQQK